MSVFFFSFVSFYFFYCFLGAARTRLLANAWCVIVYAERCRPPSTLLTGFFLFSPRVFAGHKPPQLVLPGLVPHVLEVQAMAGGRPVAMAGA